MDVIRNINVYRNIDSIKNRSFEINTEEQSDIDNFSNFVDVIYLKDNQHLKDMIITAYYIANQTINKQIPEVTTSAKKIVESLNQLVKNMKSNVFDFDDINYFTESLESFIAIYKKYYDNNYNNYMEISKKISQYIYIYQDEEYFTNQESKNIMQKEIIKLIDNMYKLNNLSTVHFILSKIEYIHKCNDKMLEDYCWDLVYNIYTISDDSQNSENTVETTEKNNLIFLLTTEIRKLLIDFFCTPEAKKNIYYKIDIGDLKNKIREQKIINYSDLQKIINIIIKSFKMDGYSDFTFNINQNTNILDYINSIYKIYNYVLSKKD